MTKEEFKKQLRRYFDSISPESRESVGGAICLGVACKDCMFNKELPCELHDFFEIMKEFEKWAVEHPQITNKEKMEEVFGAKVDTKWCPPIVETCYDLDCNECRKWWYEEYKGDQNANN